MLESDIEENKNEIKDMRKQNAKKTAMIKTKILELEDKVSSMGKE
jgi:hypothetical protein